MSFKAKIIFLTTLTILLFYFAFMGENEVPRAIKLTEKDLIIQSRMFNPSKTYVVFSYTFDAGALGYTRVFYSINKAKDTLIQINQFELSCTTFPQCFHPIKWNNDTTLLISTNRRDYSMYRGVKADTLLFRPKTDTLHWNNIEIIARYFYKRR